MARTPKTTTLKPSRARTAKAAPTAEAAEGAPTPAAAEDAPTPAAPEAAAPSGKLGTLAALLRRPEGATVADMMAATGWQAHSVRGAMAGSLKKKQGLAITSEKTDGGRIYRIAP